MSDPLLTDALVLAHRAAQHALVVMEGTAGLDGEVRGQVTAALSSALVSLDVARDYAGLCPPVQPAPPARAKAPRPRTPACSCPASGIPLAPWPGPGGGDL